MMDWQVLVSLGILIAVVAAVWRGGQANPVGTRQILDRLGAFDRRLKKVEGKTSEAASRAAVLVLAEKIERLEEHAASSGEVLALAEKINGVEGRLRVQIEGVEKAADRTEAAVQRIEGYFIEQGMKRQ